MVSEHQMKLNQASLLTVPALRWISQMVFVGARHSGSYMAVLDQWLAMHAHNWVAVAT